MTTLIKTNRSFLNVFTFDDHELIMRCIEEVEHQLLITPPIKIYERTCYQQRNVGFFSDTSNGYYYSNQLMVSKPTSYATSQLLKLINERFNADYNGILVNKYENGNNYISKHSDNEASLGNIGVLCISFGAVRNFRIRDKTKHTIVLNIPTFSGQIIHMGGDFQKEFTHEIPVEKKVHESRFSFTFRKHLY